MPEPLATLRRSPGRFFCFGWHQWQRIIGEPFRRHGYGSRELACQSRHVRLGVEACEMAPEGAAGGVRTATMTEDGASLGMGRLLGWGVSWDGASLGLDDLRVHFRPGRAPEVSPPGPRQKPRVSPKVTKKLGARAGPEVDSHKGIPASNASRYPANQLSCPRS